MQTNLSNTVPCTVLVPVVVSVDEKATGDQKVVALIPSAVRHIDTLLQQYARIALRIESSMKIVEEQLFPNQNLR